jgi:AmmeMemoRadiSam system protein B
MKFTVIISGLLVVLFAGACTTNKKSENTAYRIRPVADTVGFAHLDWQMDSVVSCINSMFKNDLQQAAQSEEIAWRAAICPHDDYTYASWLYPTVLKNMKAKTVIIFGVAHKARNFGLENRSVFDSFDAWRGPYGNVKVSPLREKIMEKLDQELFVVHDSLQTAEHSVESMIPFLQHQNRDVEIISILGPYMPQIRMDSIAEQLSLALQSVAAENNLSWGKDFALLITTDAVHYGCDEWGGKNYAPFGCDSAGYKMAVDREHEILATCFTGKLTNEKANSFIRYTVQENDYREYKWTWCGRYTVPLGLKVAYYLQQINGSAPLEGLPLGYETSISHRELPVSDLRMGKTAVAKVQHWVGYAAVGYK